MFTVILRELRKMGHEWVTFRLAPISLEHVLIPHPGLI
jgi:hypothetical protein